ncbi:MAG: DUF4433 domain-containing protein [Bdellovibrionaceae bacterium]|nr:DUF4433 domain-containing protein [Pseudobdellovibrionaceae bacterium]
MSRKVNWEFIKKIKSAYQIAFLNHFTRIENLPGILSSSGLTPKSQLEDDSYTDISDQGIQDVRGTIEVAKTGQSLHDFVPFYFCVASPMISRLREYNEWLIYLQFTLDLLEVPGVYIADGNARTQGTSFHSFECIETLKVLDVKTINSRRYAASEELRRRKQAEALVPGKVGLGYLYNIACFSEGTKTKVDEILRDFGLNDAIKTSVSAHFYYR